MTPFNWQQFVFIHKEAYTEFPYHNYGPDGSYKDVQGNCNNSSGDGSTSDVGGETWFPKDDQQCINLHKWKEQF